MTVGENGSYRGFDNIAAGGTYGSMDDASFTHQGVSYTITGLQHYVSSPTLRDVLLFTDPALPTGTSDLEVTFKDKTYRLGTDFVESGGRWESHDDKGLNIKDDNPVPV